MVVFDIVEYDPGCGLPIYEDIRVVNPIPLSGVDPISDTCKL